MRNLVWAGTAACILLLSFTHKSQAACDDRFINTCSTRSWHWTGDHKRSEFREPKARMRHAVRRIHARVKKAHLSWSKPKTGGQASVASGGLATVSTAADTSRPRDCYGIAWCGCWLRHVFGIPDRALNLAINWARKGSPASPDTANVVVWRHHVGKLIAHEGNRILIQSGNDGGAVRTRWRTTHGVVAYRRV